MKRAEAAGRYAARGAEAEFEPGSKRRVLRNRLGIRSSREMAFQESKALLRATEQLTNVVREDQQFTAADLRSFHREWLGEIYPWAGEYRTVNLSKGDLTFAAAREIPRLMDKFEREILSAHTPCRGLRADGLAQALGIVHAELVLIHPFREGNGRSARLLATLMALQAGLPVLDFQPLEGKGKARYFAAIQAAFGRDYRPITSRFGLVLGRTASRQGGAYE